MTYSVRFHGVACFSIHTESLTIVFDPHKGKSMNLPAPEVRNADLILISHQHYDHNDGKELVSNDNTMVYEEREGEVEYRGIKIVGTRVPHGGDPEWGWNVIYSLRLPTGEVFIHGGDVGSVPKRDDLEKILSLGQPDIIFLPIGGEYCLDAKQAIQTSELLNPKITTIACHYLYGPLLTKDDFQGMTDEKPFLDLVGDNVLSLNQKEYCKGDPTKKYLIFEPPL